MNFISRSSVKNSKQSRSTIRFKISCKRLFLTGLQISSLITMIICKIKQSQSAKKINGLVHNPYHSALYTELLQSVVTTRSSGKQKRHSHLKNLTANLIISVVSVGYAALRYWHCVLFFHILMFLFFQFIYESYIFIRKCFFLHFNQIIFYMSE